MATKRPRTEPERDLLAPELHKNKVLVYLSLGYRKGCAFPPRVFLQLTKNKFNAFLETLDHLDDDDDPSCILRSLGLDEIDCPVSRSDLKVSFSYNESPSRYMQFWKFVTEELQESFDVEDTELRIRL